jgi:hypothetical protein
MWTRYLDQLVPLLLYICILEQELVLRQAIYRGVGGLTMYLDISVDTDISTSRRIFLLLSLPCRAISLSR